MPGAQQRISESLLWLDRGSGGEVAINQLDGTFYIEVEIKDHFIWFEKKASDWLIIFRITGQAILYRENGSIYFAHSRQY